MKMEPLTPDQARRREELEAIVRRDRSAARKPFVPFARALRELCAERLYRATHETFERYSEEVLGISRTYAYQKLRALEVIENVCNAHISQSGPTNEAQARPLAPFDREEQVRLWKKVEEAAEGQPITATLVEQVVKGEQLRHPRPENDPMLPPSFRLRGNLIYLRADPTAMVDLLFNHHFTTKQRREFLWALAAVLTASELRQMEAEVKKLQDLRKRALKMAPTSGSAPASPSVRSSARRRINASSTRDA